MNEKETHKWTDERLAALEKHLHEVYGRASEELQEKALKHMKDYTAKDVVMRKKMEAKLITAEEYERWRRTQLFIGKDWNEKREKIAHDILNVNKTAVSYINEEIPEVYAMNYNAVGEVSKASVAGYSFSAVNAETVRRLATGDKTLLPYKVVNGVKDVRWNTKIVNAEILQGILQGESVPELASRLQRVTDMNRNSAIRNARTAITSAECKGRLDSYKKLEADGVILEKEWMAIVDSRTREAHINLDGQTAAVDKPFKSDLGDIMYPGDPNAHPANVYNCRCTMVTNILGFTKSKQIVQEENDSLQEENSTADISVQQKDEEKAKNTANTLTKSTVNDKIKTEESKVTPVNKNSVIGSDLFSSEKKKQLHRAEMLNNNNRYETAYIYDELGNLKFKVKGQKSEVSFTSKQLKDMKNCVITHNHPGSSSFSSDDISILKTTGASEVRASTRYGTYVLQRPQKWSDEIGSYTKIDKIYNSMVDDYIARYKDKAAQEGKHTLSYLQKAEEDATRAFAEKFGMNFRLEKYEV